MSFVLLAFSPLLPSHPALPADTDTGPGPRVDLCPPRRRRSVFWRGTAGRHKLPPALAGRTKVCKANCVTAWCCRRSLEKTKKAIQSRSKLLYCSGYFLKAHSLCHRVPFRRLINLLGLAIRPLVAGRLQLVVSGHHLEWEQGQACSNNNTRWVYLPQLS